MSEIEFAGNAYRIGRIEPFTQLHIARRIAPVLAGSADLLRSIAEMADAAKTGELSEAQQKDILHAMQPIADAVAKLDDASTEYVIKRCLRACHRRKPDGGWAKVMGHDELMFDDISLTGLLRLAVAVLQENFADFFTASPSGSKAPAAP